MTKPDKNPPRPKEEIADPHEFFRQGLGPGYSEEEFGPPDAAKKQPGDPQSLRNLRGDRYSRFDRPGQNNPGIKRKS